MITYRLEKGSPLTYEEGDNNFKYLEAKVYNSDTAPTNIENGTFWHNTSNSRNFRYNGTTWVEEPTSPKNLDIEDTSSSFIWGFDLSTLAVTGSLVMCTDSTTGTISYSIVFTQSSSLDAAVVESCLMGSLDIQLDNIHQASVYGLENSIGQLNSNYNVYYLAMFGNNNSFLYGDNAVLVGNDITSAITSDLYTTVLIGQNIAGGAYNDTVALGHSLELSADKQVLIGNNFSGTNGTGGTFLFGLNSAVYLELFSDQAKIAGKTAVVEDGGTTADRPTSPRNYQFYFDTDLNKPIWYNGTDWVDATGATV